MVNLYRQYKGEADFVAVYVREAHPSDGWPLPGNDKLGISFAQPKAFETRREAATTCGVSLKSTIPMAVDEIDDRVGVAYSGMPDRLYVLDSGNRVAYKGGRGPFGYRPQELEQALLLLLTAETEAGRKADAAGPPNPGR